MDNPNGKVVGVQRTAEHLNVNDTVTTCCLVRKRDKRCQFRAKNSTLKGKEKIQRRGSDRHPELH